MTTCPASLYTSRIISLRKSLSDTSCPRFTPYCQTLFAHCSNSLSCVTPRSRVIASYSVRPGDLRLELGSPPSRCLTTSVVRFKALTLLTPKTYLPSHLRRNLKFLYGSKRSLFAVNWAMVCPPLYLYLTGDLLDLDNNELGGLERREANQDVHDAQVDIVLRGRLAVAFDKVCIFGSLALECSQAEQIMHERADIEANLRPQRLVVRLENDPLQAAIQAFLDKEGCAANGDVFPLRSQTIIPL